MKINDLNNEVSLNKTKLNEHKKVKEEKEVVPLKSEAKKDIIHITESKRENNIIDKKINLSDIPVVKVDRSNNNIDKTKDHEIDNLLKKLNTNTDIINKGIRFEKDNYYDKIIVRVYNKETGEEIKQIPPQDLLDFAKKSEEIAGILFDKKI